MKREPAGLNEFQKKLSVDEVYLKNASQRLSDIEDYDRLKVLTWNIERGSNLDVLAAYINQIEPDVVCLQEVDWGNQRTSNVDVLSRLAHSTSMQGFLGVEFFEIETSHRPAKLAGGGIQGNAILTRILPKRYFRIELPIAFDWVNPSESKNEIAQREKRQGARFALCIEFDYRGRSIVICSTHLEDKDGGVQGRFAQFKSVTETIPRITSQDATSIIAGDFNSLGNWITSITRRDQTSEAFRKPWYVSECRWWKEYLLPETGYTDPFHCSDWTYKKSVIYREKLDWIAVRKCKVLKKDVGDFNTSDHRPLWVEIEL
jgi:endonuclease/exonuclease/phosphatase family metal-dependent hydrolase